MSDNNIILEWSIEKNNWLKKHRDVSFENIEVLLSEKSILDIISNPSSSYLNQFLFIVEINDYIYTVPFVIDKKKNTVFLKTIIPSRKYTKKYLLD